MMDLSLLDVPEPWMPKATLLDVTLRDGGFRTNFNWDEQEIVTVVRSVSLAGAGIVELGYIGGLPELHHASVAGLTSDIPIEIVARVRAEVPGAVLAAMLHPSALSRAIDLSAYRAAGLSMIRLVYHRSWLGAVREFAQAAKAAGLQVSVNLALASRYDQADLSTELETIAELQPDVTYIADTCAGLTPARLRPIVETACRSSDRIGFHAHDFLSLALANSLEAVASGATFVDGSLLGLGRGAGNLRTELWLALELAQGGHQSQLAPLVEAINLIEVKLGPQAIPDLASITAGAFNLTPPQEDRLRERGASGFATMAAAAAAFGDHARSCSTVDEALDAAG